mmetsp:Transcript_64354/g.199280  ORF Transcript_64354/g.199280 Transcript_64354/m.199280 type:complete len:284 (-) Transcript_64354:149-1000(-)
MAPVPELPRLREGCPREQLLPRPPTRRRRGRGHVVPDASRVQEGPDHLREEQQRAHERGVGRQAGLLVLLLPAAAAALGALVQRGCYGRHRDVVQRCEVGRPAGGHLARQRHRVGEVGQHEVERRQGPTLAGGVLGQQLRAQLLKQPMLARGQAQEVQVHQQVQGVPRQEHRQQQLADLNRGAVEPLALQADHVREERGQPRPAVPRGLVVRRQLQGDPGPPRRTARARLAEGREARAEATLHRVDRAARELEGLLVLAPCPGHVREGEQGLDAEGVLLDEPL